MDHIHQPHNDKWRCSLTPAENRLTVAIQAGEKVFRAEGRRSQ